MIWIYTPQDDTNKNGQTTLAPTSAPIKCEINGVWSASMTHPIDDAGKWQYIEADNIVKMPSWNGEQLFRIKKVNKSEREITCDMEPIFYDSIDDCFLYDVRPTGKTGYDALDIMLAANSKYHFQTDLTDDPHTAYYERKNLIEALNGEDDNAFVKRWGGEIVYDNYTVRIMKRLGRDRNVWITYGKNIVEDGIKETVDTTGVITRIYPQAFNGRDLKSLGSRSYVDSPMIGSYPVVHTKLVKFDNLKLKSDISEDSEEDGDDIVCNTKAELYNKLIEESNKQFSQGNVDKPSVNIEVDILLTEYTDYFTDMAIPEDISLGDTVHIKHAKLGIRSDARIIALEYDPILDRVVKLTIGDYKTDLSQKISSTGNVVDIAIRKDGTLMAERIQGMINMMNTQLRIQTDNAQKQAVRAILFEDLDHESPLFGALSIGTQGLQIANQRTPDDLDWIWTTAFDANGGNADTMVVGTLADKNGRNWWNLITGEFNLSNEAVIGDMTFPEWVTGEVDRNMTQQKVFNTLTENGKLEGIFMKNGKLYVNLSYLQGGKMVIGGSNNTQGTLQVLNTFGNQTGYWDNNELYVDHLKVGTASGALSPTLDAYQLRIYYNANNIAKFEYDTTLGGVKLDKHLKLTNKNLTCETAIVNSVSTYSGNYKPVGSHATDGYRIAWLQAYSDTQMRASGQWAAATAGTAYSTARWTVTNSDKRLKDNIDDCDIDALALINNIRMHSFDWKSNGRHWGIGVIADELEELDPLLTAGGGYNEDGTMDIKSVDTWYLTGYMIKAMQQLSEKIEKLEEKISRLEESDDGH